MSMIKLAGWKLICGIPKSLKEVKNIIDSTDVPLNPATFVHKSRTGHIYAIRMRDQIFDGIYTITSKPPTHSLLPRSIIHLPGVPQHPFT